MLRLLSTRSFRLPAKILEKYYVISMTSKLLNGCINHGLQVVYIEQNVSSVSMLHSPIFMGSGRNRQCIVKQNLVQAHICWAGELGQRRVKPNLIQKFWTARFLRNQEFRIKFGGKVGQKIVGNVGFLVGKVIVRFVDQIKGET